MPRPASTRLVGWVLAAFGVAACSANAPAGSSGFGSGETMGDVGGTEANGGSGGSTSTGGTAASDSESTAPGETSGPPSAEGSTSDTAASSSGGEPEAVCDILEQDCPAGQKCTIWASEGGAVPDAVRCVPLTGSRVTGDECHVAEPLTGYDDCALGLYCQIDSPADQVTGSCVPYCETLSGEQSCDNPDSVCAFLFGGVAPVCLIPCKVSADECPAGQICQVQSVGPTVCVGEDWGS